MILLELAFRNLLGSGLRTWLNVLVLSFSFIVIIWHKGLLNGWNLQAKRDMIHWEVGGGQYWHPFYDPFDPLSIRKSNEKIPPQLMPLVTENKLTPILITPALLYPKGRLINTLLKGIDPDQSILAIDSKRLKEDDGIIIPCIIGKRMAEMTGLKEEDPVTVQFRDNNGVYDALDLTVAAIFNTPVPSVDSGQIYIALPLLQKILNAPSHATLLTSRHPLSPPDTDTDWVFKNHDVLFKDFNEMIRQKSVGGMIFYMLLIMLAMITIFDSQVFSVFRRQKEIGTHMALGMNRFQIVGLFTLEGTLHSFFAVVLGTLFGSPLFYYMTRFGFSIPQSSDSYGLPITEKLFPVYGLTLFGLTIFLIITTTTIVSLLPATKISRMKPTDAIRGKIS